jgi:hypothetical protein
MAVTALESFSCSACAKPLIYALAELSYFSHRTIQYN